MPARAVVGQPGVKRNRHRRAGPAETAHVVEVSVPCILEKRVAQFETARRPEPGPLRFVPRDRVRRKRRARKPDRGVEHRIPGVE